MEKDKLSYVIVDNPYNRKKNEICRINNSKKNGMFEAQEGKNQKLFFDPPWLVYPCFRMNQPGRFLLSAW